MRYPAATTLVLLVLIVAAGYVVGAQARAALLLLGVLALVYSTGKIVRALRGRLDGAIRGYVRQERKLSARAWVELDDGTWVPVYFSVGLLGLRRGNAAAPAGRRRRTRPPGRIVDVPTYSASGLEHRAAIVGTVRRRLAVDGPIAVAGAGAGVLWWVILGGTGGWALAVIGVAAGYWWAAIAGSDPS